MPGVDALPTRPELPDVLTANDGSRVTTPAQWKARREEMKRTMAYYAAGLMPPAPGNVRGQELKRQDVLGGKATRIASCTCRSGPVVRSGSTSPSSRPPGRGPFPTVVFPSFSPTPGGTPLKTMVRPPEQGKGGDTMIVPLGDQTARAEAAKAAAPPPPPGRPRQRPRRPTPSAWRRRTRRCSNAATPS